MSDWDERHEKPQRDPTEGVRIIGADEAAEALERGDVRRRLSEDEPRFGDRPPQPSADGHRVVGEHAVEVEHDQAHRGRLVAPLRKRDRRLRHVRA